MEVMIMFKLFKKPQPCHCDNHDDLKRLQELVELLKQQEENLKNLEENGCTFKYSVGHFNFVNADYARYLRNVNRYWVSEDYSGFFHSPQDPTMYHFWNLMANILSDRYNLENGYIQIKDVEKYPVSFLEDMQKLLEDFTRFVKRNQDFEEEVYALRCSISETKSEIEGLKRKLKIS
jgi:hypothetical protein